MNDFIRPSKEGPRDQQMKCVSLAFRKRDPIRSLPGFKKKTHRIPDQINSHTQAFVAKLGTTQVRADLDEIFAALRSAFRFKRTEMESDNWEEGCGTITTPFFRYTSSVCQNPNDATEAIWRRDVSEVKEPLHLLSDNFAAVFDQVFDTVEFIPNSAIDLELLIDRIEELDDERVSLKYDRLTTYCEIAINGNDFKIHVTPEAFRIVHPQPTSPRLLVESLFEIQKSLVDFSELDRE